MQHSRRDSSWNFHNELAQKKQSKFTPHFLLSPEIKAVVGSGNQAERKIDIMDNFLDLGRSLVPDNLFQVIMMMIS